MTTEDKNALIAQLRYAITEKDNYGKYWHDLAQERIAKASWMETEAKRVTALNVQLTDSLAKETERADENARLVEQLRETALKNWEQA